jgi:hypothetical protein
MQGMYGIFASVYIYNNVTQFLLPSLNVWTDCSHIQAVWRTGDIDK